MVFENWNNPSKDDRNLVYFKGAYVIHLLKEELGDETFWDAIRFYSTKYLGKTVETVDFETGGLCDCNCLYDLEIELNGVDSKKYQVKFIEPYARENKEILFEMDLTNTNEGTYCVTRKQYPWGME